MFSTARKAGLGVATLLCICGSMQSTAHHSVAGTYDVERLVEISGVITNVTLRNPHLTIELATRAQSGAEESWVVEMAAPNALVLRGMSPRDVLVVGRQVAIEAWPAKDGTNRASAHTLTTADGTTFDVTDNWGRLMVPDPEKFEVIDRWAPDAN
jgi:hypothetical protein